MGILRSKSKKALAIQTYPNPILRKKSKSVKVIEVIEQKIFNAMVLTMRKTKGVGLAAPQIGISRRFIVADIGEGVVKLANPEIVQSSGRERMEEGCLSVPGESVEIERATKIVAKGLDAKGEPLTIIAEGLLARVIQHEIDHLNGKLIIDHAGSTPKKSSTITQM